MRQHYMRAAAGYRINQPAADTGDQHIANTELLLQGEGNNGQTNTTFLDSSPSSHTITRNGDTTQGSFSPFSPKGWSGRLDGIQGTAGDSDCLTTPTSSDFNFGTGDFTVEAWVYWENYSNHRYICDTRNSSNSSGHWIFVSAQYDGRLGFNDGTQDRYTSNSVQVPLYTWCHVAVSRSGGTLKLFINGVAGYTVSNHTVSVNAAPSGDITIGARYLKERPFFGYLSNVRIIKGTGLYTNNFTPPTKPFTAVTNTKLLTLQDNRFIDNSSSNHVLTAHNDIAIKATSPFSGNLTYPKASYFSGKFDGSNDYLNCGSSSDFAFGTGDFTVEAWVYSNGTQSTAAGVFSIGSAGTDSGSWQLDANASAYTNKWGFVIGSHSSVTKVTSSSNIVHNQWTHLAVTRDASNVVRFFVNGVLNDSQTITNNLSTTGPLKIGTNRNPSFPSYFDGYISNARVIKGTALYTTTFTPPTAPLTPVTNTKLLTLQDNYLVDHSSSSNPINNNGGVTLVPESPFDNSTYPLSGTFYSGYVDGNGDTFEITNSSDFNFGTGDFTLECWFNITSFGSVGALCLWDNYNGSQGPRFNWNVGATGGGPDTTAGMNKGTQTNHRTVNIQTNEWHHTALVRDSTGIKIYLDGELFLSYATSPTEAYTPTNNNPRIGDYSDNYVTGAGYISNFRVVKGTAVYTSNFTVPTEPLTAIPGTVLLTLQDATLQDNSASSHSMSTNGNATITEISPFGTALIDRAGSIFSDGYYDYLRAGSGSVSDFVFGTGDFTVEAWVYRTGPNGHLFDLRSSSNLFSAGYGFNTGNITTTGPSVWDAAGSSYELQVSTPLTKYAWTHVAYVRKSQVLKIYVNGVEAGSASATRNLTDGGGIIMANANTVYYSQNTETTDGYVSDLRVIKGTALYTSNFTPPTAPLQPITNTVLLLNGNNGGVEDSLGKVNLFTNGPAPQINTTVKKFGTGSVKFDGSNDWLLIKHDAGFNIESGDFTIEGWYYRIGTGRHSILNKRPSSGNSGFELRIEPSSVNNNPVFYFTGGSSFGTINYSMPSNQWVYIAVVRSGSNAALFVDGQRKASSSSWADGTSNTESLRLGNSPHNSNDYLNGYLDDFRLTKGVARYNPTLTTHTVPTTTHPTI